MSRIAIVGSAEVVIRAVGDRLEQDIQNALERGAAGARASGRDAGREFGRGVGDGVAEHDLTPDMTPDNTSVDRIGDKTGRRLGDQIGKGVERSRFQSSIIRSFLKLNVIIPIIGTLVGGISTLVSGLFAVVAAAGNASSALIVLPGILSAIGAAAFTATLGFQGVGKALATGMDPSQAKQFQKALDKLPPSAQKFVKEALKMRDAFRGIRAAASEGLFDGPKGLTAQLKTIAPLLPTIAGGFRATGQALRDGIVSALRTLTRDNVLENFSIVASTNNHVIRDLGRAFGEMGSVIIAVLSAASPVIVEFSGWLADFSKRLRESSEAGAGNNNLTRYFLQASQTAKVFIDIAKNLFTGLYRIGQIAFPFGLDLALGLREATKELANFTKDETNVNRLAVAFGNIHDNMMAIAGLVKDLGAAFLRLGAGEGIGNTANALRDIVPDIEALLQASLNTAPALVKLVGGVAKLLAVLQGSQVLATFVDVLGTIIGVIGEFVDAVPGASTAISTFLLAFGGIKAAAAVIGLFGNAALAASLKANAGALVLRGGMLALKAAGAAVKLGMLLFTNPLLLASKAMVTARIVMVNLKVAMSLLNLAFKANPIGFVVTGLLLLVAGFKLAWNHSETFRKIVVGALKAVIGGFQGLVGFIASAQDALGFDKAAAKTRKFAKDLDGTKKRLDGLVKNKKKIPVDADAKKAYNKLNNVKKAGDSLRVRGTVDLDISQAIAALQALKGTADESGIASLLLDPVVNKKPGTSAGRTLDKAISQLQGLNRRSRPSDASSVGGFGDAGSGGSSDSGKEKKDKPEVDFQPIKDSFKKTADDMRSALESFVSDVVETKDKAAIKLAQQYQKKAEPFLKALEKTTDNIKKFADRVKEVQQSLIDRSNIFTGDGGSDIGSLTGALNKSAQESADFATAVKDLRAAGLNNKLLQQFVQAGPDALAKAASILRSGPEGIAQLNKSINQVSSAGQRAGKESAASTLNAGKLTADAFINGLKAQKKTLEKQFADLATVMGQKIAKTLGKSADLKNFPSSGKNVSAPRSPAKGATVTSTNTVQVTQIYNGPTTGSSRNKELDWTLRYSSPTASNSSAGGNSPVGVER